MEKFQEMKQTQERKQKQNQKQNVRSKSLVWDCGSSLYDSFELKSFERQLDSAINSRTLSMPHLPDQRVLTPPSLPVKSKKPSNKISRSLQKFLKSVFKPRQQSSTVSHVTERQHHEYYIVYDKSGALSTIPEVSEIDLGRFSPEIKTLVRRTASDRFTRASIGISCA